MSEEPVEIELRLNQDVDSEGKKATASINDIADASATMKQRFEKNIASQKKVINDLNVELAKLKAQLATPSKTNDAQLIADKEKLTQTIVKLESQLKQAEAAFVRLGAKQKQTTISPAGISGIGKTAVKAATGVNQLGFSVQQVARELPTLALSPQMFILAISNNLPILQDQLKKTRLQNQALKASGQSTVPVFKQVLKSIVSWQTALVVGVTLLTAYGKEVFGAIGNLLKFGDAARMTKSEVKALNEEFGKAAGGDLGKMNLLFDSLKNAKKGTNEYYSAKRDIIKQYGSYLTGLDSEITALNNVEAAHKAVTDAIVDQARQKALSTVYSEQGEKVLTKTNEQYKIIKNKMVELFGEGIGGFQFDQFRQQFEGEGLSGGMQGIINSFKTSVSKSIGTSTSGQVMSVTMDVNPVQDALDAVVKAQTEAQAKIKQANSLMGDTFGGTSKKVKSLIQDQKDLIAQYNLMPTATKAQLTERNKLIEAAENEIKTLNELGRTNKDDAATAKKQDKKDKAGDDLKKMQVSLEEETAAATIAAMQDGTAKKLAEIDAEYAEIKNRIAARLKEIEELEKTTGYTSTGNREQLAGLAEAESNKYKGQKSKVTTESKAEVDGVFSDINERFTSQLDNQLNQVNAYYDEQLKTVKENITDTDALRDMSSKLEAMRLQELAVVRSEMALKTIEFDEQVALQRQTIANKELLWEADKQKALLEIQKEAAQQKLDNLEGQADNGADVQPEIDKTKELLDTLSGEIDATGPEKLAEIADAIGAVGGSVAGFISVFDEDAGKLAGWASEAAGVASSLAKGDYIQAGMQALSLVGSVISANREANKEIEEFNYNLAQQAIDYSLAVIEAIKDIESGTDSIFSTDSGNILTQSMTSYNAAIAQQTDLTTQLGEATVKTGVKKKKFLGITYGTKSVYSDLLKTYPDLIDSAGVLNEELAQSLIDSGNLNDKSQALVQSILDAATAADEAMNQFESTLSSLIGQMGDDLKTVLDDAFASGEDAGAKMMSTIGDYIQQLATSTLWNSVFGDLFSKLETRMKGSYGENGDFDLTDDLVWFMDNYSEETAAYNEGLKQLQAAMSAYNLDMDDTERTPSSTGIAQASQDTVDELNGRITNMQQMIYDIRNSGSESLTVNNELLMHQKLIRSQIDTIAENSDHLKKLVKIEKSLSDMSLKGVKIKT